MPGNKREAFNRALVGDAPKKLSATIKAFKKQTTETAPKLATSASSEKVLEVINPIMPDVASVFVTAHYHTILYLLHSSTWIRKSTIRVNYSFNFAATTPISFSSCSAE
jgi:phosphohistidine phosphatase SixA